MRLLLALLAFVFVACEPSASSPPAPAETGAAPPTRAETPEAAFVQAMQTAHEAEQWDAAEAVAFDLVLRFGGAERLRGTFTMLTSTGQIRFDRADGATVLFDGEDVFVSPADAEWPRARFDVLTWSYFFAAPYKFDDSGTVWTLHDDEILGETPADTATYEVARLTFAAGTGDAPDDWYRVYRDPTTGLLRAMAYIVTYGQSVEEANAEPHAITYADYAPVDGVPVARSWGFWMWTEADGLGEQLGSADIANVRFVPASAVDVSLPADRRSVPPPAPSE